VNKEQNITFITHTILLKSLPETMLFGSRGNVNVGGCEICLTESGDTTLRSQTLTVYEPKRFEHILDVIILSMLFIGVVLFSFPLIEIALEWH